MLPPFALCPSEARAAWGDRGPAGRGAGPGPPSVPTLCSSAPWKRPLLASSIRLSQTPHSHPPPGQGPPRAPQSPTAPCCPLATGPAACWPQDTLTWDRATQRGLRCPGPSSRLDVPGPVSPGHPGPAVCQSVLETRQGLAHPEQALGTEAGEMLLSLLLARGEAMGGGRGTPVASPRMGWSHRAVDRQTQCGWPGIWPARVGRPLGAEEGAAEARREPAWAVSQPCRTRRPAVEKGRGSGGSAQGLRTRLEGSDPDPEGPCPGEAQG